MKQPVRFGKYVLLDRISIGGMAEVFRATTGNKVVALKRILPSVCEDQSFIKMFVQEARIGGQLFHPNLCETFELGRIDGTHFIAMEFIWGKDVLQIINRLRKLRQPMPLPMVCAILTRVLAGLEYAHRKRDPVGRSLELVHRDCSPHNVLMSYEGEVKVIDFGIAKARSRIQQSSVGTLKGKFAYMSPEQANGQKIDRRSDIFALGVILYECLTCERLFHAESDFSILEKVRAVTIRPPREVLPTLPEALEAVILKALAKEVADRYQWCSEMSADLKRFPAASTAELAEWMKRIFAKEIATERDKFSPAPPAPAVAQAVATPVPFEPPRPISVKQIAKPRPAHSFEPEATDLDAPAFLDPDEELLTFADLPADPPRPQPIKPRVVWGTGKRK